ncbi:general transcription factor II-I repeat domain-containing protein 1-like isoform X5 [Xyrauchen texanus]|uniref:general transcription factor II-I repeat domain-containing protein 1-like isoform X5 n=1 Tax=Xyrauchen texanus TaxID=154827 RepID=UPI002241B26A|nr:general transcription factor II-I repeat domain-containing protein 1-like isoform X5 [Xyrauchen texanus]
MAQIHKLGCDVLSTNSRPELKVPHVSARQEILTSLVSALDSVCSAMSKLNAEVACVTVHEDSVIAVGTEKGRIFLNSRKEIQTDFHKFCKVSCLQALTSLNSHPKVPDVDSSRTGKECGQQGRQRALTDTHSNIFVLRKMVEEVFSVLYSEAVGKSSLVPMPYDWILKDPSSVVAYGLPDGVTLRKPSEYDTKTLMKILEQSNRIRFIVKRTQEEPTRDAKSCLDVNHHSSISKSVSNHASVKPSLQEVSASNSMLSSFLYSMPMSSQPHPDSKLDLKPISLHSLGKERLGMWASADDKAVQAKEYADNGERIGLAGDLAQSHPSIHVSKRLLFSIVHEKSEKWDLFIRETEDINTLRECVQILFNSRYAEALGLDHMVPVPYRKIACDPEAVEIIGIPDKIPFKRPCTYGVPKLKRILEERHAVRFVVKRMFDERIFTAAGKVAKEEGKQDGATPEDGFPDGLRVPSSSLDLVSNTHSSRSTSSCVSPLVECEAGPSGDCLPLKKIKTEPPDGEIIQVTVPESSAPTEEPSELPAERVTPDLCRPSEPVSEDLAPKSTPQGLKRAVEEDIGEMILQLRKQAESLFSSKYSEALGLPEPAKVPYSKFQMYPDDLHVTGLPEGMTFRRPNCFGAAKLQRILAASSQIKFVIKRPELLTEQVKHESLSKSTSDSETDSKDQSDDPGPASKRPGFSDTLEAKLSRIDLANTLREQVQDLFNRKYGEALGIKYPVQVPYKRIKSNPGSVIIEGLPPGIPFRKPCTFGSQNLERILAVADKISFSITRPFQGLIPKPAPRRITIMKKGYTAISEEDEINRMGEKVILREQVKELFNKKYGDALGLDRSVLVPYKLIRANPGSFEVSGLPDDIPFRNPNTYDIVRLEKILQVHDEIIFNIKTPLQPFTELCSQSCNTEGKEASTNRRKRKRVLGNSRAAVPTGADSALSTNQIPVMQWPMYMVDYSGVNVQVPGKVKF